MFHLVRRFFGSIMARRTTVEELKWVDSCLTQKEFDLWRKQSRADQRHTFDTAKRVQKAAQVSPGDWRIAASLMHDIGKTIDPLGTFGRVVATLLMRLVGRKRFSRGAERRDAHSFAAYANHPYLGEELLQKAGSDPRVCTWAAEHHLKAGRSSLPSTDVVILLAADN